jgi:hypothetical protein
LTHSVLNVEGVKKSSEAILADRDSQSPGCIYKIARCSGCTEEILYLWSPALRCLPQIVLLL